MKLIFRGKVVIADVNEDASEKIAKEFNVNKSEIIAIFHKTDGLRWILKLELLELKISFNRPTYDVLYQRRVYEVSSNKCVRCNDEVETWDHLWKCTENKCVLFDLWKEAVNVFTENGDERRQYYDLITLKSRLFPLENLLYEITHGIINFKIWKYKHCKVEDTSLSRPGYGIPLGGISPMAKLTTLFIGGISPGVTDD
ncbi:hypothetical protein RhiirA4_538674 [Rhizophagus irregularis]|uniref:Uncharacterized protein n=1 Tax=Rhizophagus irregularis TaxID=588596 RepID=A0A2I1G0S4_9GLOM|nr:hypothetical protein RhiirA4_538674 [Rhizophagus irregularis]